MKTIRIGNGAGFWGDNRDAPHLLTESGQLDYLTLEYLAELTLSILAHQKSRDPQAGYVTDFPAVVDSLVPCLLDQPGLRIITNAGGMNPAACARKVAENLSRKALQDLPIGVVTGDDLLPDLDRHQSDGETFQNLETGRPLEEIRPHVASANAYLGAGGITEALSRGARIVITGRVADASLTVGPAVHEFGWAWDDWERLAAATVAGHLIECGAQVTGGFYSQWTDHLPLADVGYPIAELSEDGLVTITKPPGTGGIVTTETVAEQLVYEIGDPAHYLTPDVDADFRQVQLVQKGPDRVIVQNAGGNPAPESYKVSVAYRDGYLGAGTLLICGPNAPAKARRCADIIFQRVRRAGFELARTHIECLGAGDSLPGVVPQNAEAWEVVLRISAQDPTREAIEQLLRELAPLVTSGPPGVTGYTGARPRPHPVFAYWPTSIARSRISSTVAVEPAREWVQ